MVSLPTTWTSRSVHFRHLHGKLKHRIQGLDALMVALQKWNGGVIIISHDERFITTVAKEVNESASLFLA